MDSNNIGQLGEQLAKQYLLKQGLVFRQQNYRCRQGEIDLVMSQADEWIFVEVKTRKTAAFGSAAEAVTRPKQQKLIRTAQQYLLEHRLQHEPCRFDVITISSQMPQLEVSEWIKNAFQV